MRNWDGWLRGIKMEGNSDESGCSMEGHKPQVEVAHLACFFLLRLHSMFIVHRSVRGTYIRKKTPKNPQEKKSRGTNIVYHT